VLGPGERGGPPEGLILLVFAVLTIAASAFVLIRDERNALHDPVQKAARGEIKGLGELSLVRERNLRKVLDRVAASRRPLVVNIRVAPTRANLIVSDADGSQRNLSIDPALGVKEVDTGVSDDDAVRALSIDPAGPERMLRAVAERTRLGTDAIDYVTLSPTGFGQLSWYLYLKEGPAKSRQWVAAMNGTDVRHQGELPRVQREANARRQRRVRAQQARIRRALERRSACVSKARDGAAVTRCIERYQP
jgi:hypothetical protein